jgi:uncharacterized membrane protein YgcG
MRKRVAVLLAPIVVLVLMAAGPGAAQVEPESPVTVCALVPITYPIVSGNVFPPGSTLELPPFEAEFLIQNEFATLGPCQEGGDGGGGGGGTGGGGTSGGGQQGGGAEITQEGEQEAEAGEIDQSFDVS